MTLCMTMNTPSAENLENPAAYFALIEDYHTRGLTDGIPVIPVTPARLQAMVAATGRPGGDIVGAFPGGRQVTIGDIACIANMAGCLPAYMPLVATAFEIMLDPGFPVRLFYESAASYFPFVIINGPQREKIGINCRPDVFGPGFRANAAIGRALRLGLVTLNDRSPGSSDPSSMGTAYRYSCVIGEDEENSPWPPLHTELGFSAQDNTVTVLAAWQPRQVSHQLSSDPEHLLRAFADEISTPAQFNPIDVALPQGSPAPKAILVVADDHRGFFKSAGWSRQQMQEYFHKVTGQTAGNARAAGYRLDPRLAPDVADDKFVRLYNSPQDFLIVSAGSGGGRSMVGGALYGQTRRIAGPVATAAGIAIGNASEPRTVDDYAALVDRYIDNGTTDGWPVLPPTRDGVEALIAASGRDAALVIGTAAFRLAPITVQDIVVNAFMAGCQPAHMPLLMSICELLFADENAAALGCGQSTAGYYVWFLIHGPIVQDLQINASAGLFGPGSRVNVAIGRAIRLCMMNLAGIKANLADRSCIGTPYKFGTVIGEDAGSSPWGPLHTEFGFSPDAAAFTQFWGGHPRLTLNRETGNAEELLRAIASDLGVLQYYDSPNARLPSGEKAAPATASPPGKRQALVVLDRRHAGMLSKAGYSRADIGSFLADHSARGAGDIRWAGYGNNPTIEPDQPDSDRIPRFTPDRILIFCAGGDGGASMTKVSTLAAVTRSLAKS